MGDLLELDCSEGSGSVVAAAVTTPSPTAVAAVGNGGGLSGGLEPTAPVENLGGLLGGLVPTELPTGILRRKVVDLEAKKEE